MRLFLISMLTAVLAGAGSAQIRVTALEKVPLGNQQEWCNPQLSPDGKTLYVGGTEFNGIWRFDLAARTLKQVTAEPKSGYGFSLSADGTKIGYRVSRIGSNRRRLQDAVIMDVRTGSKTVVASGRNVGVPVLSGNTAVVQQDKRVKVLNTTATVPTTVLGIENTKIAILHNGVKKLLDPLGKGSYIWPSLSPDGTRLVAYEMDRGAFICDLSGRVIQRLGRIDAPSWSRSGRWLVYMDDKDDGQQYLESDLYAITPDGTQRVRLTDTPGVLEMHPVCSTADNKVVCDTPGGDVYILSYEEAAQ